MIEQKKLSRRDLLKGLVAAPLVIPFQADAQTIYRAITTEWANDVAVKDLLVTSEIFSFSQPSHIVEAFGDLYTSFMTLNTVITDLRQRDMLLPVGNNKKVQLGSLSVNSQKVSRYYHNITTNNPNRNQRQLLSIIRQSSQLGRLARSAYQRPSALAHGLDGCVFYHLSNRYGVRDVDPNFIKVGNYNNGLHDTSVVGSLTVFVTQALFQLGSRWLSNWWKSYRSGGREPDWKDTGETWRPKGRWNQWYRQYNPVMWHDTASRIENVSSYSKKSLLIGFPGGHNQRQYQQDRGGNVTINIYWYPSYQERTWMGESPSQWQYDRQNRPQMVPMDEYVSNPFNLLTFKDSFGRSYGQFFRPIT